MAGCNGNCKNCPNRSEEPRSARPLAEALAQVIVDNRVVRMAVELSRANPTWNADQIVEAVSVAKLTGEL